MDREPSTTPTMMSSSTKTSEMSTPNTPEKFSPDSTHNQIHGEVTGQGASGIHKKISENKEDRDGAGKLYDVYHAKYASPIGYFHNEEFPEIPVVQYTRPSLLDPGHKCEDACHTSDPPCPHSYDHRLKNGRLSDFEVALRTEFLGTFNGETGTWEKPLREEPKRSDRIDAAIEERKRYAII